MYLFLKNLTSNNISIEGDGGKNRVSVSSSVGSYARVLSGDLIGDNLFCTTVSSMITNSKLQVTIGSLSGTVVTATGMLRYATAAVFDNNGDGVMTRWDIDMKRVKVTGLAIDTLNDEVSTAIGGSSANLFVPNRIYVQIEDVGAGAAATGDFEITVGTSTGGTQILAATACTGCNTLNETFQIDVSGVLPAITEDSTLFVKCTTADSTAGAGHLADIYIQGELFVAGA
jgi:hypothetical protein